MDSPVRRKLQLPFTSLDIGSQFQIVNQHMKAALPDGLKLEKISTIKAKRLDNGEIVDMRLDSLVEPI